VVVAVVVAAFAVCVVLPAEEEAVLLALVSATVVAAALSETACDASATLDTIAFAVVAKAVSPAAGAFVCFAPQATKITAAKAANPIHIAFFMHFEPPAFL
jgi:hypothetical protein